MERELRTSQQEDQNSSVSNARVANHDNLKSTKQLKHIKKVESPYIKADYIGDGLPTIQSFCFARVANQTNILRHALVPIPTCMEYVSVHSVRIEVSASIFPEDCRPSHTPTPPAMRPPPQKDL